MKIQIARIIFLSILSIMKKVLDLGEFKLGKNTSDYLYYKKFVMDVVYGGLNSLFKQLKDNQVIEKCICSSNLRQGYSECKYCSGAGYKNTVSKDKETYNKIN